MVPIAEDHARAALYVRGGEQGIVTGGQVPVALDVRLIDQVDAILVAQFVPAGMVRIVAGAHRVQVVLLDQADVLQHRGLVDRLALQRVVLVPVHAAQHDGHAVHQDLAGANLDLAKAHAAGSDLGDCPGAVAQLPDERVEVGLLSVPLHRRTDRAAQTECALLSGRDNGAGHCLTQDRLASGVEQVHIERVPGGGRSAVIPDPTRHVERSILAVGSAWSAHTKVAHVHLRRGPDVHVAVDAAQAPMVLILKVTPI